MSWIRRSKTLRSGPKISSPTARPSDPPTPSRALEALLAEFPEVRRDGHDLSTSTLRYAQTAEAHGPASLVPIRGSGQGQIGPEHLRERRGAAECSSGRARPMRGECSGTGAAAFSGAGQ